jgi:hypothetical protein
MNSNLAEVSKPAQWKPGQSGNPAGKPPGTRTAAGAAASCRPYRATGYLAAERRCAISTTTRTSGISIRLRYSTTLSKTIANVSLNFAF